MSEKVEPVKAAKAWTVVSEMWGLHADTVTTHKSSCEFLCKQSAENHPDAGPYRVIPVVITPEGE